MRIDYNVMGNRRYDAAVFALMHFFTLTFGKYQQRE